MSLEFDDILAGKAVGLIEENYQTFIDNRTLIIDEAGECRMAGA